MQLAQRKIKILKAVVEAYIKNGEPVGSKLLCNVLDFPVSSATVRNEMAELSELGLLVQPHTSAGRIPSEEGYKLYVSRLMDEKKLSGDTKALVYDTLIRAGDNPEKLLKAAAAVTARLTGSAVIAAAPSSDNTRIHRLRFVQTGRQTCMAVLITSSGLIKTALFKCDYVITPDIIRVYESMFNRSMEGMPIKSITPAFVQTLAVEMGELAMLVPSVLAAVMTACREIDGSGIIVEGRVNLLKDYSDPQNTARLLEFLHNDEALEALAGSMRNERSIEIGSDTGFEELRNNSVIACRYSTESSVSGSITAIVPMRTDYAFTLAVLDYTTECVSSLLRSMLMID